MRFHHFKFDDYADWQEFYKEFLKTNRLSRSDCGTFSVVYEAHRNSRFIYKVTDELTLKGWDGYIIYLKGIVLKQQDNPHVPKIYGVNTYEYVDVCGTTRCRAIIKMERLLPYYLIGRTAREDILRNRYGIEISRDYYGDDGWLNKAHDSLNRRDSTAIERIFKNGIKSPKLLKVFTLINKHIHEYKDVNSDIHDGNIMWRKRGQNYELVIVDPIA